MLVITNIFNNLVIIIDIWITWFDLFCGKNNLVLSGFIVTSQSHVHALIRSRSLLRLIAVRSSTASSREVSSAYRKLSL